MYARTRLHHVGCGLIIHVAYGVTEGTCSIDHDLGTDGPLLPGQSVPHMCTLDQGLGGASLVCDLERRRGGRGEEEGREEEGRGGRRGWKRS